MNVEIVCILDRSGSMSSIRSDAIGGFSTFERPEISSWRSQTLRLCCSTMSTSSARWIGRRSELSSL